MSIEQRAAITVINLWERWTRCARCDNDTPLGFGWEYYEDFIIGEGAPWQERGGCVPVCHCCYLELMAAEAQV